MVKSFCEACGKRWYYFQGGVTVLQDKKRKRWHKECWETNQTR